MAFRITPSLGPAVDEVYSPGGYWFRPVSNTLTANSEIPSYQLNSTVIDNVGEQRRFVRAGGSPISAEAQVIISDAGIATAGSGGWYAKSSVPANGYFHATNVDPA